MNSNWMRVLKMTAITWYNLNDVQSSVLPIIPFCDAAVNLFLHCLMAKSGRPHGIAFSYSDSLPSHLHYQRFRSNKYQKGGHRILPPRYAIITSRDICESGGLAKKLARLNVVRRTTKIFNNIFTICMSKPPLTQRWFHPLVSTITKLCQNNDYAALLIHQFFSCLLNESIQFFPMRILLCQGSVKPVREILWQIFSCSPSFAERIEI